MTIRDSLYFLGHFGSLLRVVAVTMGELCELSGFNVTYGPFQLCVEIEYCGQTAEVDTAMILRRVSCCSLSESREPREVLKRALHQSSIELFHAFGLSVTTEAFDVAWERSTALVGPDQIPAGDDLLPRMIVENSKIDDAVFTTMQSLHPWAQSDVRSILHTSAKAIGLTPVISDERVENVWIKSGGLCKYGRFEFDRRISSDTQYARLRLIGSVANELQKLIHSSPSETMNLMALVSGTVDAYRSTK